MLGLVQHHGELRPPNKIQTPLNIRSTKQTLRACQTCTDPQKHALITTMSSNKHYEIRMVFLDVLDAANGLILGLGEMEFKPQEDCQSPA